MKLSFASDIFLKFVPKFLPVAAIFLLLGTFVNAQTENAEVDPVEIFNRAQTVHEKGDLTAAIKLYDEALKAAPEFPEAEYQRATAYLALERRAEAENGFRRALALREDWTLPMTMLGEMLLRRNRFDEAETLLLKATTVDPQNAAAYVSLTELRLQNKASASVLLELYGKVKTLSEKVKTTASVWAARGALERALGDKAAAQTSLNRALQTEPANNFALFEQVNLSLAAKDFTRAIADARTLVKTSPNSASAKVLLARALAESGNDVEALKILDAIDAPNPEAATLKISIAAKNSTDVPELEKKLAADPKNAEVLSGLCNLTRTTNPAKSLEYCRRAWEIDPSNANHAVGYGAALVQAKQFDAAINLLRKLQPYAPENYTLRANLATALFQLKRYAEAKTEYLWLTEKKPDLAIGYYFLAIAHDNLSEYLDAMADYRQFLQLADKQTNLLEIEKVNLRLPILQKLIKEKKK